MEELLEETFSFEEETTVTTEAIVITESETASEFSEDFFYVDDSVTSILIGTELGVICSQNAEIQSLMEVSVDRTTALYEKAEIISVLAIVAIAFCGFLCGLLIADCIRK